MSSLIQCLSLNLELANSARLHGQKCLGIVSSPSCQGLQVFTVMLGIELRSRLRYDKHVTDWIIFPTFLFIQRFLWLRVHPSKFLIFLHSFVPIFWLIRQVCSSNPDFCEMLTHVSTVYLTFSLYL